MLIKTKIKNNSKSVSNLRNLFANDPYRGVRFTYKCADLTVDLSKNLIDTKTISLLTELAAKKKLKEKISSMFSGEKINNTENRAVLHTALRNPTQQEIIVDGQNVLKDVHLELEKIYNFATSVITGKHKGFTGKRINTVVNIGIGGSDLGPKMVYDALRSYRNRIKVKFISNIDPCDSFTQLEGINPETTLFIISSKTFTTLETMANANICKNWFLENIKTKSKVSAIKKHFIAISTAINEVKKFGIDEKNVFRFWDWVGGRYSVDSAIGMSIVLSIGPQKFQEFLSGFYKVDEHFRYNDYSKNVPILMGLLSYYYIEFFNTTSRAVLPYCQDLSSFPAYLQQLTMESNGKSVRKNGKFVNYKTGDTYFGEPGTNGQHAFYQLLHQGTQMIPADFIGFKKSSNDVLLDGKSVHNLFMSNFFAQTQALAFGKTAEEVEAEDPNIEKELINHKVFTGNRPSNSIIGDKLSPLVLGELIALYEHITFVCGVMWDINSFDQWGVQLGKVLASQIQPLIEGKSNENENYISKIDSSTKNLLNEYLN